MHTVYDPNQLTYSHLKGIFQSYADLGVTVNISELDIRMSKGSSVFTDVLEQQGDYAYTIA